MLVELPYGAGVHHGLHIENLGESCVLASDLSEQRSHEVIGVEPSHARALHEGTPGGEIVRHRHRRGRVQQARSAIRAFAEHLQQHVSTEGEAQRAEESPGVALADQPEEPRRVAGVAGMVEVERPIRLAAAAAEIHGDWSYPTRQKLA